MLWIFHLFFFFPRSLDYLILPTFLTSCTSSHVVLWWIKCFKKVLCPILAAVLKKKSISSLSINIMLFPPCTVRIFHGSPWEAPFPGNFLCFFSDFPKNIRLGKNIICKKNIHSGCQVSVSGIMLLSCLPHLLFAAILSWAVKMTLLSSTLLICAKEIQVSFLQAPYNFYFFYQMYPSCEPFTTFLVIFPLFWHCHSKCQLTGVLSLVDPCVSQGKEASCSFRGSDYSVLLSA